MNFGLTSAFPVRSATSGAPLRVVELTSGSGTFAPLAPRSWCRVTVVGGGGGGGRPAASGAGAGGGGGGGTNARWVRVDAGVTYSVGAGGAVQSTLNTAGNSGSSSRFWVIAASGGVGGPTTGGTGAPGGITGNDDITTGGTGTTGGAGGRGGTTTNSPGGKGAASGYMIDGNYENGVSAGGGSTGGAYGGGGGGGDSAFGAGGSGGDGSATNGVSGSAGTGFGGGGGGAGGGSTPGNGGAGASGVIIIEEFGA